MNNISGLLAFYSNSAGKTQRIIQIIRKFINNQAEYICCDIMCFKLIATKKE